MRLYKLTGHVLLCLAFFSSGLIAQEDKFSLSSHGDELSPACPKNIKECNKEYLCKYGTTNINDEVSWINNPFADEARIQGFTCGVVTKSHSLNKSCTSDAQNCSNQQLCKRATNVINGFKVWDNRSTFINYSLEAKKRLLDCGVYQGFNLALPEFIIDGEIDNKINDKIKTIIKDQLLKTNILSEVIEDNYPNRGFNLPVDYSGWQSLEANFLITGLISVQGNELSFKYRLFDISHEKPFGKIINFVTKLEDFDEMSQRASGHIIEQIKTHLNSSNQKDTIKLIQGELIKAQCEIDVVDGIIGNKTKRALLEVTHKLGIGYSDTLVSTQSYMFHLLKKIKNSDLTEYWCSSNSTEYQDYEEAMQMLLNNDFASAVSKFGKFIEVSSNTAMLVKAHYFKGNAYSRMQQWKSALISYLKSYEMEVDGKYSAKALKASYQTALMPLNENNFELAIVQLNSLIDVIPNGPLLTAAHYSKGDAYSGLKEWKAAGKSYLESFRLEPDGKYAAKALMNVGISLGKMQKINEACNILSRVEQRFPESEVLKEAKYEMQLFGCS
jgi:TolA-binding protein